MLANDRFNYPPNHIEADNRLSWLLGRLDRAYGANAYYVHLKRNDQETAESFLKRYSSGIIRAYRGSGIIMGLPPTADAMSVCLDYCNTVNSNIDHFLKGKPHKMRFSLENAENDFPEFCDRINAKVDLAKALMEFTVKHNASAADHT